MIIDILYQIDFYEIGLFYDKIVRKISRREKVTVEESFEYQIYIGCRDPQSREVIISWQELRDTISRFFERKKLNFSLISLKGGYLYEDGWYDTEDSLCISIIGDQGLDIVHIARNISEFMNQKCFLIVKSPLKYVYC